MKTPIARFINPDQLSPPHGFSHACAAIGMVWVAGQISSDASGNVLHAGDITAQFSVAIENVRIALKAAGSTPESVVKITYFVTDVDAYKAALESIGASYRSVMGKHFPPSTLIGVPRLFEEDAMIEIECVAVQNDVAIVDEI